MHLPFGHGGISAGISKCVFRFHTHFCCTLNMTRSSGFTSLASDLYATDNAQPPRSEIPLVWNDARGDRGHGKSGFWRSRASPPGPDAYQDVTPLSQANSTTASPP